MRGASGLIAPTGQQGAALDAWHLNEAGQRDEAERLCRSLVAADPTDAHAWCTLGVVLDGAGRFAEAIESYRQAIALQPLYPVAHSNLAKTLITAGRFDEASASLDMAIAQKPDLAAARFNLGVLHMALNRYRFAVDAFRESLELRPDDVPALVNLGRALIYASHADDAVECFEQALGLNPEQLDACAGLATALAGRGDLAGCLAWLRRALELSPESLQLSSTYLSALQYDPALSAGQVFRAHTDWAKRHAPSASGITHRNDWDPQRRLRVGYLSPDLRIHPVAYFVEPILAHHDTERVHSICYSDSADCDEVTARLQSLADSWRATAGLGNADLAKLIIDDGIDILVDLAGHTTFNRLALFAQKPAPVQVTYMGYPGTTGVDAIDYCLVDDVTAPAGEEHYFSERLERLPHGFCCYAGAANAPDPGPPPARECGFVTFGSMHKPLKLNAVVLDLWAAVLCAVPDSRILLVRMEMTGSVAQKLRREFSRRGVPAGRLDFCRPLQRRNGHLEGYLDIDISLDTTPWNGHATACDSLWMGVPMVTLRGDRHAGRMTASVLTQVGLGDLVTDTPEAFCRAASSLSADLDRLAALRGSLRERMRASGAGDGARFTAALEDAYRRMWRKKCAETGAGQS